MEQPFRGFRGKESDRLRKRGGEAYLRAVRENVAKHEGFENYREVAEERAQAAIIARVKEDDVKD